jgi:hypothetical protein
LIVVQIDGLGPSDRSKTFHDVGWPNLGDAGRPDRGRWIRAAARTRPKMDRARVGIYGPSAAAKGRRRPADPRRLLPRRRV